MRGRDIQHMAAESKEIEKTETKRTVKDSVFCNLFSDSKYLLQLYQALHPEDKKVCEDDLKQSLWKIFLQTASIMTLGS